jgi:hypothetical protein
MTEVDRRRERADAAWDELMDHHRYEKDTHDWRAAHARLRAAYVEAARLHLDAAEAAFHEAGRPKPLAKPMRSIGGPAPADQVRAFREGR